ncbi:hypothetical protein KC332_g3409 [Hortaea werneckii]|uniref:G-protein coupled receptors family 1 profile domain-containing protein n=1 Tax=Hortaea werneckii TaxID=91943 RepID=A0A3M7JC08_HORWE|nr:hypothetical protein KC350_g2877 [Hortaea werneckii]KAI6850764.1 hypothetical protein KC358_g549 [Hortaea werneckii]KAI6942723.1 hypothetical protein KC341_g2026 [Hortaea werneckii]KAI6946094.1 hypothetical protein KC348_g3360 [Hortaea werneckii]KAI6981914.1 hypothetical protein KC321_g942 [Hortaea werneckii]
MAPMSTIFARTAEPTGSNPEELVYTSAIIFAFFSLLVTFLIIPPLVQHWRNRNIGATLCVFYAMIMNLMAFTNAVLWPNDDLEHWYSGSGLCDVEVKLQIAWSVAAPATLICVLRALANAMNTDRLSLGKTKAQRWRGYAIDLTLCVGIPLLSMVFHFIVQSKRYFLYGISGCVPTATQSYLTVGLIYVPPLLLVLVDAYFALLILYRLCRYRRTFSIILAHNDTTKSRFLRLYILCIVWLLGIIPLSSWMLSVNLGSQQEPYKWVEAHDYSKWNEITMIRSNGKIVFDRFIWLGCGIMVFLTFGFGKEAVGMYRNGLLAVGLGRLFPGLGSDHNRSHITVFGSIGSLGSKTKLYFTRKSSAASSWQTQSWQTDTSASHKTPDRPMYSPKNRTFFDSIAEDKDDVAVVGGTPAVGQRQSRLGRITSLFKSRSTPAQQRSEVLDLGCARGERLSSYPGEAHVEKPPSALDGTAAGGIEVIVKKEVRQSSETAGTLPPRTYDGI